MKFTDIKHISVGESILIKDENHILRPATISSIEVEDRDAFIRCDDGHLYHHTALVIPKK